MSILNTELEDLVDNIMEILGEDAHLDLEDTTQVIADLQNTCTQWLAAHGVIIAGGTALHVIYAIMKLVSRAYTPHEEGVTISTDLPNVWDLSERIANMSGEDMGVLTQVILKVDDRVIELLTATEDDEDDGNDLEDTIKYMLGALPDTTAAQMMQRNCMLRGRPKMYVSDSGDLGITDKAREVIAATIASGIIEQEKIAAQAELMLKSLTTNTLVDTEGVVRQELNKLTKQWRNDE